MTETKDLTIEFENVVQDLERIETELRLEKIPSLTERAPPIEFDDLQLKLLESSDNSGNTSNSSNSNVGKDNNQAVISQDGTAASLRRFNLRSFSLSMIVPPSAPTPMPVPTFHQHLTTLDVSNNEIMDIPGLSNLSNLKLLNLERGWFNTLPTEIGSLKHLETLIASRNFLRPNANSLQLSQLKSLLNLKTLDLTYNQKCGTTKHCQFISQELTQVKNIKVTLWEEVGSAPGSYVGASACERDPKLLRSQLEPWGTVQLRKRLVQDFNQLPTDASVVDRAGVMMRLLECYQKEGLMVGVSENESHNDENTNQNYGFATRKRVRVDGTPVCQELIDQLLVELRSWTKDTGLDNKNRERPSIDARNYMILRKPHSEEQISEQEHQEHKGNSRNGGNGTIHISRASRRAMRKAKKMSKYRKIWDLAIQALHNVNPIFANQCTEVAVTFGFQGSPHIDKQNSGPFYGLAIGNFPNGQGGICVECSARVVAVVNTKHRLGQVDGRYPHWVDAYDQYNEKGDTVERYSLIYYETGGDFKKPGPAIFSIPSSID